MNSSPKQRYGIFKSQTFQAGGVLQTALYQTYDEAAWLELCEKVEAWALVKPKLRPKSAGNARPVICRTLFDYLKLVEAKDKGKILRIPKAGEQWPSVTEAADSLGCKRATLRQLFYLERLRHPANELPIKLFGMTLSYLDRTPESIALVTHPAPAVHVILSPIPKRRELPNA